jgi:hypothetical protein
MCTTSMEFFDEYETVNWDVYAIMDQQIQSS